MTLLLHKRNSRMEEKDGVIDYNIFVSHHRPQLELSAIPQQFWLTLHKKLEKGIFDAGETFSFFNIDYEGEKTDSDPLYTVLVNKEDGISCEDGHQVYLVDHAWTYVYNRAVPDLMNHPGLLSRMSKLMGVSEDLSMEAKIEKVCSEMWKYNQTYSYGFGEPENRVPVWYIMDEFGSGIQHSADPNFRAVPFYYIRDQISYTLLFPIRNVGFKEEVTRNYLEGSLGDDELVNAALSLPWTPASLSHVDYTQTEPGSDYFLYGHVEESLPQADIHIDVRDTRRLRVYSEYDLLSTNLTDPGFEIVVNEDDADILWLSEHFKNFKELSENHPEIFINQFPFEHVLTVKDLLSIICRRKRTADPKPYADNPPWCPTTYNLKTEIPKFVSYYKHREEEGLNNHWICKPWNLARGLDIVITDNLNCILRLQSTGPKIAQKYIEKPVLFDRSDVGMVKFDVRYVVLLKSVQPLKAYAYKNFFLRFANKTFDLTDLWDTEKHFTVMNYNENANLFRMLCKDFVTEFNRQNPSENWDSVEKNIFLCLREVFQAATMKPPPCGISPYESSRALYAVDLILAREVSPDGSSYIQPKILEVNWNPDCKRACEYYPTFFNDVFNHLFKDIDDKKLFEEL